MQKNRLRRRCTRRKTRRTGTTEGWKRGETTATAKNQSHTVKETQNITNILARACVCVLCEYVNERENDGQQYIYVIVVDTASAAAADDDDAFDGGDDD